MWKQEAPVTRCEDWVGASPHGAAVGVFFLCPSVLLPLRRRRRFCQEVYNGKLMVIVYMFLASLHRV